MHNPEDMAMQALGALRGPTSLRREKHLRLPAARDPAFAEVASWIEYHGGHVNQKLDVAITPLGCRFESSYDMRA